MKREHLGIVGLALMATMVVWQAVELLTLARAPGTTLIGVRVIVALAWVVAGVFVGFVALSLLTFLDDHLFSIKPARRDRLSAVSPTALMLSCLTWWWAPALGVVTALASCLDSPGHGVGLAPAVAGFIVGSTTVIATGSCLMTVLHWRRARAEATHDPGLSWDVSLLEPLS